MSTSAQIEAAWLAAIWNHADILAITNKLIKRPQGSLSEQEYKSLYTAKRLNFIEALTSRTARNNELANILGRATTYEYLVQVSYYKDYEDDTTGAARLEVRDFFETLHGLVVSELGNTWSNTVEVWKPQEGQPEITDLQIDNKRTWRGSFSYTATKIVSS